MHRILVVQPIVTKYRIGLFDGFFDIFGDGFCLVADMPKDSFFGVEIKPEYCIQPLWKLFFSIVTPSNFKIFSYILKSEKIVHVADFKYLTLWFCVIFTPGKLFLHGQGGYKKNGFFLKVIYKFFLKRCKGYICYSNFSRDALLEKVGGRYLTKISVVENSLYLKCSIESRVALDVLYIGRLRTDCGIEFLLEAAEIVGLKVRVIGGGEEQFVQHIRQHYQNFSYYGALFDETKQYEVAKNCFTGAYGGDAGLSVVHYMAFGLPVIVHDDLFKHMGPEPSYIVHGENGLTFQRGDLQSLVQALTTLKNDVSLQTKLAAGATATFQKLNTPPMHEKFAKILGQI